MSMKRQIAGLLLVCLILSLLTACGSKKEEITADQAWKVVCEDLQIVPENAATPHIHSSNYNNQECFNIFVTINGESLMYVVSNTGEILYKGQGSHSH